MGFNPFKKKNLWDEITGAVSGAVHEVGNAVGSVADKVIPGDQSSWHNQGQSQQSPQQSQAPIYQPAQDNGGGLQVVSQPINQPKISWDQPKPVDQSSITGAPQNLQVQKITAPTQTITQPKPTYNVAAVDQGLNQGKSWEQISKETGTDVNTVRSHSQATRPNYGMHTENYLNVDNKSGTSTVNNTTPDTLSKTYDKMSGEDKKVYHSNLQQLADSGNFAAQNTLKTLEEQGKFKQTAGSILHGVGNFAHDAVFSVKDDAVNAYQGIGDVARGELAREDLNRNTDQAMKMQHEYTQKFNNPAWTDAEYQAKWHDPAFKAEAQAANAKIRALQGSVSQQTQDDLATAQKVDAKKVAFAAGSTALNIGTLGVADLATVPLKQVAKMGVKELALQSLKTGSVDMLEQMIKIGGENYAKAAAEEIAKQGGRSAARQLVIKMSTSAGKDAMLGAAFGGVQTGTHNPNATAEDFAKGVGIGGVLGAAGGVLMPLASAGKSKVVGIISDNTERRATEAITGKATSLAENIANEKNPSIIQKALNVPDHVAEHLAQETDKTAVQQVINELAVDPSIQLPDTVKQKLTDEGITSVKQDKNSQYDAQTNPDGSITVRDQASATEDNLYHEVGHRIYTSKLTAEEKAAFANINGDAAQQARGRAGYTADDIASEDFSNFTRLAIEGKINEVPEAVRGIVAKYARVSEQAIAETKSPISQLSRNAKNSLENDLTGIKPNGVERSGGFVENGTAKPVEYRTLEDGSTSIVDGRHTLEYARKNGIHDFPTVDVTDQYSKQLETPALTQLPDGSLLPVQKPNTTTGIGSSLPSLEELKARTNGANPDLAAEISAKYGGDAASVARNIDRYGEEATRNMYARKSDALPFNPETGEGIKNIDAVVTAELKKSAPAKVKITNAEAPVAAEVPAMSPEELASLDQYSPTPPSTATPELAQAPELARPNELVAPAESPIPQSAAVPEANPRPANVDPATGEVMSEGKLGNIVKDFYDKYPNEVKFEDLQKVAGQAVREAEVAFKQIGSDVSEVAQKAQTAYDNKLPLEQAGLNPAEIDLWNKVQSEFDYVRNRAGEAGRNISEGDQGNLYFPAQRPGQYPTQESLVAGFNDKTPGNEFSRQSVENGGIPLNERDFSAGVIGDYIIRYGDERALNESKIGGKFRQLAPAASDEQINAATGRMLDVQNEINNAENKITMGGFGKRVIVTDGKTIDLPAEMSGIGKDLGMPQTDVIGTPHGLTNGQKIDSVAVNGKKLGDELGLNQHRDAANFANAQVNQAGGDATKLIESVRNRLAQDYQLPADDITRLLSGVENLSGDLPDQLVAAKVTGIYTTAAKQQLMEKLQSLNILNPKLRQEVSALSTQILREGTIEQKLSTKLASKALTVQNAVFRKLNVSSALNELSDMTSFASIYGTDLRALKPDFSTLKNFGLGDIDPAMSPYVKELEAGGTFKDIASKINNATNLYHFVETYKAAVVATSARDTYMARGLVGDDLTKAILQDYRNFTLPVDAFTKTFLDNYPLYTQYMTWGARNIQKEVQLARGKLSGGKLIDMSEGERIARNLYANLPAKTVFWLASNGLKGTAIVGAFGLTDFTGLSNQDYSGIAPEDKSNFDKSTQVTNSSTTLSLLNSVYQAYEKEQLKNSDKYKGASYNPYANNDLKTDLINTRTPQIIKNVAGPIGSKTNTGALGLMKDGYSQNKDGRVQYEAPKDPYNIMKAFVFGKGQTDNAREYTGAENVLKRIQNGDNPIKAVTDMAKEQVGAQDPNFNRPLTQAYSDAYKAKESGARTALLQGGRQYNDYLDNLKKSDPTSYDTYIKSLDGNHVSPEYWKAIGFDAKGGSNMAVFDTIAARKKQQFKDLGTPYEPTYDLTGDQAKSVIQLKSAATGDDLALRGVLNKEGWYKDYKKSVSDYYAANPAKEGSSDFPETQRVKEWNGLSDKLNSYFYDPAATETPEWGKSYPMVYEQKRINDKFGFDSQESKDFFKANADAYHAQKDGYDQEQLAVINQLRKIEGYPPMGAEAYKQATNVADTSGKDKSGYGGKGKGGYSKSIDPNQGSFGSAMATGLKAVSVNSPKVAIKSRTQAKPKAIKVVRGGKI